MKAQIRWNVLPFFFSIRIIHKLILRVWSHAGTYLRCHSSLETSAAWMRLGRASHGDSSLMAFTIICSSTVAAICCCILLRSRSTCFPECFFLDRAMRTARPSRIPPNSDEREGGGRTRWGAAARPARPRVPPRRKVFIWDIRTCTRVLLDFGMHGYEVIMVHLDTPSVKVLKKLELELEQI